MAFLTRYNIACFTEKCKLSDKFLDIQFEISDRQVQKLKKPCRKSGLNAISRIYPKIFESWPKAKCFFCTMAVKRYPVLFWEELNMVVTTGLADYNAIIVM